MCVKSENLSLLFFYRARGPRARGEDRKKKEEGLDMREEGRGRSSNYEVGASQWWGEEEKKFYPSVRIFC